MINKLEKKAQQFAIKAHKGQFRKDRVTPYITHPEAVVNLLLRTGIRNEEILCSAWLHDVIEDCGISREFIKKEFNSEIARIVANLTRDCNRKEYNKRIKGADFSVKIIKLADMIHNCSDINQPNISNKTKLRKINDCNNLYFELARQTYLPFYSLLKESVGFKKINMEEKQ